MARKAVASEITTSLEVWLLNQRAGTLWLKDGELQFQYGTLWLEQDQLSALLDDLPQGPMQARRDGLRLSLAGDQDKLPVVFDGGRIGLPLGSRASTHILKPAIAAVEGSVLNEAFRMALGQAMGLRVAEAEILTAGERQVLVVRRYDRSRRDDERWLRLHQEDFCQALGIPPE